METGLHRFVVGFSTSSSSLIPPDTPRNPRKQCDFGYTIVIFPLRNNISRLAIASKLSMISSKKWLITFRNYNSYEKHDTSARCTISVGWSFFPTFPTSSYHCVPNPCWAVICCAESHRGSLGETKSGESRNEGGFIKRS